MAVSSRIFGSFTSYKLIIHSLPLPPALSPFFQQASKNPSATLLNGSAHTIHQQLTQYLHIWQSFHHFSQGGQWLLLFVFPLLLLIVTRTPTVSSIFTTRRLPSFPAKAALKSASTRMHLCRSCSKATSIQTSFSQQRATGSCWWLIPLLKLWLLFNGHFPTPFKPRIPSFFSISPNPPSFIVVN